ncbi:hypothetical protein EF294_02130 [Gordonia oryzae]|uniref:Uncharacterized protein n=1 Tax=Gordonia oryzae TaxID=2487349 RepID=A0A3N4GTD3_9ACTN|nr:hypothetical protein [Gordonia oryzae]RPA65585.1 hypothetical protein EF294_02130 [Gordonia oryzae]
MTVIEPPGRVLTAIAFGATILAVAAGTRVLTLLVIMGRRRAGRARAAPAEPKVAQTCAEPGWQGCGGPGRNRQCRSCWSPSH